MAPPDRLEQGRVTCRTAVFFLKYNDLIMSLPRSGGFSVETATVPCEMLTRPDAVTVILRPAISHASWSDVEAFGANVRQELENRNAPACLVDLSQMTYMGSSLVALIVRIWKVIQTHGGKMVVLCPNPAVLDVIRLAGLDKIWTIAGEPDEALKKLGVRPASTQPVLPSSGDLPIPLLSGSRQSRSPIRYVALGVVATLLALLAALFYWGNR